MSRREKLGRFGLGALAAVVATLAYRSIQHWQLERAVMRTDCPGWHWLPFDTGWLWPYASMFVLVGLPWFLLPEWRQVRQFAWTLLAVAAVGWITFMVYPTACARPPAEGQSPAYALLLALDAPNNCLPCLHSAFAMLAGWTLWRGSPAFRGGWARLGLAVWLVGISMSIVALRQHTDTDMLIGALLGGAAGRLGEFFTRTPGPSDTCHPHPFP